MKQLKLLTAAIIAVVFCHSVYAQSSTNNFSNSTTAPYVFWGEITGVRIYAGDKDGKELPLGVFEQSDGSPAVGYSSATINVTSVLRGSGTIVQGTIEMITTAQEILVHPVTDEEGNVNVGYAYLPPISHDAVPSAFIQPSAIGTRGLFFCTNTPFPTAGGLFNNTVVVAPTKNCIMLNKDWIDIPERPVAYAWGFGKLFYSQNDVDAFIHTIDGIDHTPYQAQKKTSSPDRLSAISYEERLNNYQAWLEFRQSVPMKKNPAKDINAVALELELANPTLTGDPTNKYLEFDVLVYASDNTTYFDNCLVKLEYSGSAFGTNIVANNTITITRGPLYDNATYTDPDADVIDGATTVVNIPLGSDFTASSWNRTAVTIFPEVLMHVKIKIQNCNQLTGISFNDITFTPMFSFYTSTANADILDAYSYDLTNYYGQINDAACVPIITSFTDYIPAGTGFNMTITGRYFGNHPGALGTVIFKNADQGNYYPPMTGPKQGGIEDRDTISWTDNEIQIRLPSIIDNVPNPSDPSTLVNPIPGSGLFKVVNFTNTITESTYPLHIPYAVYQLIDVFPYQKTNIQLSNKNGSGGYTVHCNPALEATFPGARALVRKAMRDWSCATGINWTLGNDTALVSAFDGVCIVNVGSFADPAVLQSTTRQIKFCSSPKTFYLESFDIVVKETNPWQIDSAGPVNSLRYDFYQAVSHEFGHAHLLSHANDSLGDLMFWYEPPGPYPEAMRKRVWSSYAAMSGGNWVANNLIAGLAPCTPVHVLNYPSPAACLGIGIEETGDAFQVSVYPNPTTEGTISIRFTLSHEADVQYVLYNSIGQELRSTVALPVIGNVTETLYIGDIASGSYILHVLVNGEPYAIQLIKN